MDIFMWWEGRFSFDILQMTDNFKYKSLIPWTFIYSYISVLGQIWNITVTELYHSYHHQSGINCLWLFNRHRPCLLLNSNLNPSFLKNIVSNSKRHIWMHGSFTVYLCIVSLCAFVFLCCLHDMCPVYWTNGEF